MRKKQRKTIGSLGEGLDGWMEGMAEDGDI